MMLLRAQSELISTITVVAKHIASNLLADFPQWTLLQRAAAPVRNGAKLMAVGVGASLFGVMLTNTLIWLREAVTGQKAGTKQAQNPLTVSSAYGLYMATSSNLRYQVVAGVLEERGIEVRVIHKCLPEAACHVVCVLASSVMHAGAYVIHASGLARYVCRCM